MKNYRWLYIIMAVAMTAIGCSRRTSEGVRQMAYSHPTTPEYQYFYLEALRQQNAGNYDAAFDLITHCIELDSLAPEAYNIAAMYYSDLGMDSITQVYLQKAVELNPYNDTYHEHLAQWHIQTREYGKAIDDYEKLFANNKSRSDVLNILLQLYQQQKDYDKMLSTIDRIENLEGTSEDITLSKMQVYQMKGDKSAAFEALKNLAEEHPNDINYKLMMGNWLLGNDRVEEAREIFLQAEVEEPKNETVAASLYDFYRQQGEDSLCTIYRDRILMNKYTESRTKMTMMQQAIRDSEDKDGDSIRILRLFDEVLTVVPDADLAQLKAVYMSLKNMPEEEVSKAYEDVLAIAPDNAGARLQLVQSHWKQEDWQGIKALCRPALEYNPDEMAFCYFLGLAHYQMDEKEEALDAFRHGVSRINKNSDKEIVSDFYALMGDILHQTGKDVEAYAAYDSCLQWKPDNIGCLNNYAYYISEVEGGDLKRAATMSLITVNAEPNNSTYLDTYAWILYKQEKFLEAEAYIDRAVENADSTRNNNVIYEHAGDIHLSCDDPQGAVIYWKKALEDGTEYADRIKKKIKKYEK